MKESRLSFLGTGNIAQAIIGGLLDNGFPPKAITASDPIDEQLKRLAVKSIHTTNDNIEAVNNSDVIVISVKPDVVGKLIADIAGVIGDKLVISVAAGVQTAYIAGILENDAAIVRCMPNTPALVRRAMTGLFANEFVSTQQKEIAGSIMSAIGEFIWFDEESHLDAVTAISGSGPAYFFYVMEAMEEAGAKLGLPPEVVHKLVTQTAFGAASMALTSQDSPGQLRRKVTSPGGTTEAALNELQNKALTDAFDGAIKAAWQRSKSLSGT